MELTDPNNLISQKAYPPGYKPNVVIAIVTLKYYNNNNKKQVNIFVPDVTTLTLDDDFRFPTPFLYHSALDRLSKNLITHKKNKLFFWIHSIEVIKIVGSISYNIDYSLN
jgi:hypothetical protein